MLDSIDNAIGDIAVVNGSVKCASVAIQIVRGLKTHLYIFGEAIFRKNIVQVSLEFGYFVQGNILAFAIGASMHNQAIGEVRIFYVMPIIHPEIVRSGILDPSLFAREWIGHLIIIISVRERQHRIWRTDKAEAGSEIDIEE